MKCFLEHRAADGKVGGETVADEENIAVDILRDLGGTSSLSPPTKVEKINSVSVGLYLATKMSRQGSVPQVPHRRVERLDLGKIAERVLPTKIGWP